MFTLASHSTTLRTKYARYLVKNDTFIIQLHGSEQAASNITEVIQEFGSNYNNITASTNIDCIWVDGGFITSLREATELLSYIFTHCSSCTRIKIQHCCIDFHNPGLIAALTNNQTIDEFDLTYCNHSKTHEECLLTELLCQVLQARGKDINSLRLGMCRVPDRGAANILTLAQTVSLFKLDVSNLGIAYSSTLRMYNQNTITCMGFSWLLANPNLKSLNISGNALSRTDALMLGYKADKYSGAIQDSIRRIAAHTHLKYLDMSRNGTGKDNAVLDIFKALSQNTSLCELVYRFDYLASNDWRVDDSDLYKILFSTLHNLVCEHPTLAWLSIEPLPPRGYFEEATATQHMVPYQKQAKQLESQVHDKTRHLIQQQLMYIPQELAELIVDFLFTSVEEC